MALYGLSLGLHIPCRSRVNLHLRCGIYWLGRVHRTLYTGNRPQTRPYAVLLGRPWKKPTLRLHACSGGHLVDGALPVFLFCFDGFLQKDLQNRIIMKNSVCFFSHMEFCFSQKLRSHSFLLHASFEIKSWDLSPRQPLQIDETFTN